MKLINIGYFKINSIEVEELRRCGKERPFPLLIFVFHSGWQVRAIVCRLLAVTTSPGLSPVRAVTSLVLSHWGLFGAYRDFGR
jgi:hypothetical protein